MKKLALVLCLTMAIQTGALAASSFPGSVVSARTVSVVAPYGGLLNDFALREGDAVKAGDELFSVRTRPVYAPADGLVSGLRAQPGDEAAFVQDLYGALLYIAKPGKFSISTSTRDAHDDNTFVQVGETVYIQERSSSKHTGMGFVSKVNGANFTVEVTSGNLRLDQSVNICRKKNHSRASRIGKGKTQRLADVPVTAEGSVLKLYAQEGDEVKRGDLVAEMVDGALDELVPHGGAVTSPVDGLIASVAAAAGAKVEKDQVLATVYPIDALQVAATVSESDLGEVAIGQPMKVELESGATLVGTALSLSGVGKQNGGDVEYTLYVSLPPGGGALVGMSATVYPIT